MIAAGFGDMLGKFTALADWRLGHLVWDEPYDERIAQRTRNALQGCVNRVEEIGIASEDGVRSLMEGLIESGFCMMASRLFSTGGWGRALSLPFLGNETAARE